MASGRTTGYNIPYPLDSDPVDVAGDVAQLADFLDKSILPNIEISTVQVLVMNDPLSVDNINPGDPIYVKNVASASYLDAEKIVVTVGRSMADDVATFPAIGIASTTIDNTTPVAGKFATVSGPLPLVFDASGTAFGETWEIGDILYVSNRNAGSGTEYAGYGLTNINPATIDAGYVGQIVAIVIDNSVTTGRILLAGGGGGGGSATGGLTWGQLAGILP